jgi:hypothetical protein
MSWEPWTPVAVAVGAAIKPLMDKLCNSQWWERRYEAESRKGWRDALMRLLRRQ